MVEDVLVALRELRCKGGGVLLRPISLGSIEWCISSKSLVDF